MSDSTVRTEMKYGPGRTTQLIAAQPVIDKTLSVPSDALRGQSCPLGATLGENGVNFSVYSRDALGVDLLLFDRDDDARPARAIPLDPFINRSYTTGTFLFLECKRDSLRVSSSRTIPSLDRIAL